MERGGRGNGRGGAEILGERAGEQQRRRGRKEGQEGRGRRGQSRTRRRAASAPELVGWTLPRAKHAEERQRQEERSRARRARGSSGKKTARRREGAEEKPAGFLRPGELRRFVVRWRHRLLSPSSDAGSPRLEQAAPGGMRVRDGAGERGSRCQHDNGKVFPAKILPRFIRASSEERL